MITNHARISTTLTVADLTECKDELLAISEHEEPDKECDRFIIDEEKGPEGGAEIELYFSGWMAPEILRRIEKLIGDLEEHAAKGFVLEVEWDKTTTRYFKGPSEEAIAQIKSEVLFEEISEQLEDLQPDALRALRKRVNETLALTHGVML